MLIYDSQFGNITIAFNDHFGHFQHDWWIVTCMTNFPFFHYRSTSLLCCMLAKTNLSNFVHKASVNSKHIKTGIGVLQHLQSMAGG